MAEATGKMVCSLPPSRRLSAGDSSDTAANMMFVSAHHVDTDIIEDGNNGLWSIEMQVWGEGPASLFQDGKRYEGGWTRSDPEQMLQFADETGNPLAFKPGNTWFEVVPLGFDRLTTEP